MTKDETWLLEEKYGGLRNPQYEEDCDRLAAGEPVAYVIGHQPFLGLRIYLDSHPLIPRPETEWWVEQILSRVREPGEQKSGVGLGLAARSAPDFGFPGEAHDSRHTGTSAPLRFLDLCAGSGAIGCAALARLPSAQVHFGEVDPAHEATIEKNIHGNGLDRSRAYIGIGDLFAPFSDMQFDIIAANPPYIPEGRELPASVTEHEPALALRSGSDGLDLIRRIAAELPARLAPGGSAWIECDREHAETARDLFTARGLKAAIRTDQYEMPRLLVVSFP